jgi:hypothetical protein
MGRKRRILQFVDETAIPYGDDYEHAVQVMTAQVEESRNWVWMTWAELPDGGEFVKRWSSQKKADMGHETCVRAILKRMDDMNLPEAERKLQASGLLAIDGIGGFIAEKDGVTYIRRNGSWEPMPPPTDKGADPSCEGCQGRGLAHNFLGMEVECDCKFGADIERVDCPQCSAWVDRRCTICQGTGEIIRRKRKLF